MNTLKISFLGRIFLASSLAVLFVEAKRSQPKPVEVMVPAPYAATPASMDNPGNCTGYEHIGADPDSLDQGISYLNSTGPGSLPPNTLCGNNITNGCAPMFSDSGEAQREWHGVRIYICGPQNETIPCSEAAMGAAWVRQSCTSPSGFSGTYFVSPNSATGKDLYVFVMRDRGRPFWSYFDNKFLD